MRLAALVFLTACLTHTATAADPPIVGQWLTQGHDGVIAIAPCAAGFCGRIMGMSPRRDPDGSDPVDTRGQKICGLQILTLAASGTAGKWTGHITDPKKNATYTCEVTMNARGDLLMRGYLMTPLLGQTQTWTHYTGTLSACAMS